MFQFLARLHRVKTPIGDCAAGETIGLGSQQEFDMVEALDVAPHSSGSRVAWRPAGQQKECVWRGTTQERC